MLLVLPPFTDKKSPLGLLSSFVNGKYPNFSYLLGIFPSFGEIRAPPGPCGLTPWGLQGVWTPGPGGVPRLAPLHASQRLN